LKKKGRSTYEKMQREKKKIGREFRLRKTVTREKRKNPRKASKMTSHLSYRTTESRWGEREKRSVNQKEKPKGKGGGGGVQVRGGKDAP